VFGLTKAINADILQRGLACAKRKPSTSQTTL